MPAGSSCETEDRNYTGNGSSDQEMKNTITKNKGTYLLILRSLTDRSITAGKLGRISIKPGYLAYAGSARGGGGLERRILRHIRTDKKKWWHIDYLRPYSLLEEIWFCESERVLEHKIAAVFEKAGIAAERFGSSDCSCRSHLFYLEGTPSLDKWKESLETAAGSENVWNSVRCDSRLRIVISRCLDGYNCRYDGKQLNPGVIRRLHDFAELVTVCPEREIGLPVPRKPVDIILTDRGRRLIQFETGRDLTSSITDYSRRFLSSLQDVDGFIMKDRSPSCGIGNARVIGKRVKTGSGFFSSISEEIFPGVPAVNIEELHNPAALIEFLSEALKIRNGTGGKNERMFEFWIKEKAGLLGKHLLSDNEY